MRDSAVEPGGLSASRLLGRLPVALPFLAVLAGLIGQLTVGRAVVWTGDSFGFTHAGILAAGESPARHLAGRNLGYPLLTALLLPLGGLRALVTFQSVAAACGHAALLMVLRVLLRNRWAFCAVGLAAALIAYASDHVVVYAQTLNADSLFGSFLVMALLSFLLAWRRTGPAQAGLMIGALALSYCAYLVKPNGILVIGVCLAGLALIAWRSPRLFLNRSVASGLMAVAAMMAVAQGYQSRWKDPNTNFGAGMLFAAHLNLIDFDLDRTTPEHRALHEQSDKVLNDPRKWTALGFDADLCYYGQECQDAIRAAAKADHADPGAWMMRQVLASLARHPKAYAVKVAHQTAFFFAHPDLETELVYPGAISDADWDRIAPYARLVRFPRAELDRTVGSWFAERHLWLSHLGKQMLHFMLWSLPIVAIAATLTSAVRVVRRRKVEGPLEQALVSVTTFVMAAVLSVALPFTFDIPRYAASFALLTYLWWIVGVLYLVSFAVSLAHRVGSLRVRFGEHSIEFTLAWPGLAAAFTPAGAAARRLTATGTRSRAR
jgi:hypothetical protein